MTDIAAAIMQMQARQFAMPPNSPKRAEPKPEPEKPPAYRALHNAAEGLVREVVELHQPVGGWHWHCKGCDPGTYAEDEAYWPCSTIDLIADALGISLRDDDYTVDATQGEQSDRREIAGTP